MKNRSGYAKAKSWWQDFRQNNWTLVHYLRRNGKLRQDRFLGEWREVGVPRGVVIAWKDKDTNEIGEGWSFCHDREPLWETEDDIRRRVDIWKLIHPRVKGERIPSSIYEQRVLHQFPLDQFNRHVGLMKAVLDHHGDVFELPREVEKVLLSDEWRERKEKYFARKTTVVN